MYHREIHEEIIFTVLGARRFNGGSVTCKSGKLSIHLTHPFRVSGEGSDLKICPYGVSGVDT